MDFKDLKERYSENNMNVTVDIQIDEDLSLEVRQYLPIDEKAELIAWVVDNSLDNNTGCFSPLRVEVSTSLAILKWYAEIEIDGSDLSEAYDLFEVYGFFEKVESGIPEEEIKFLKELILDTVTDISRYNNSLRGMLSMMDTDVTSMDKTITDILEKIKNKEGMEQLAAIRDVVGTD